VTLVVELLARETHSTRSEDEEPECQHLVRSFHPRGGVRRHVGVEAKPPEDEKEPIDALRRDNVGKLCKRPGANALQIVPKRCVLRKGDVPGNGPVASREIVAQNATRDTEGVVESEEDIMMPVNHLVGHVSDHGIMYVLSAEEGERAQVFPRSFVVVALSHHQRHAEQWHYDAEVYELHRVGVKRIMIAILRGQAERLALPRGLADNIRHNQVERAIPDRRLCSRKSKTSKFNAATPRREERERCYTKGRVRRRNTLPRSSV